MFIYNETWPTDDAVDTYENLLEDVLNCDG